jgi:hypothetical protein
MKVPENKVHLAERDIEDYLFENPGSVIAGSFAPVTRWLYRQYKLPSGIADLIGITVNGDIVVVEVKNVAIDASALTQVSRYAYDIDLMIDAMICRQSIDKYRDGAPRFCLGETFKRPVIFKVVIGRSIDNKTMYEAEALHVHAMCFHVELSLETFSMEWDEQQEEQRQQAYEDIATNDGWDDIVSGQYQKRIDEINESLGKALGFTFDGVEEF